MYAVVFQVDMKPGWEGNVDAELDALIETVKAVPGFVRGTWATNGKTGTSFILLENEAAAKEMADGRAIPPEASVTFRAVDIYEIVRDV
jgi:quinol monooxygenase YgiN